MTSWGPNVQARESMGDTLHFNHNHRAWYRSERKTVEQKALRETEIKSWICDKIKTPLKFPQIIQEKKRWHHERLQAVKGE